MTHETPATESRGLPPGARGIRLALAPSFSVVVASTGARARLEGLLGWLVPACQRRDVELVVARSTDPAELAALASAWPSVLFMPAPDGSTGGQLRAVGLTAADGDIVVLTEDDRALSEPWLEAVTTHDRANG
jgi:hypothetical protein